MHDPIDLLKVIAQTIYDRKGFNIIAIDVREISSICDFVLIAEGSVERHVKALTDYIIDDLKKIKVRPSYVEGDKEADWIVIDYLDIIVHLFTPQMREKFKLERLFEKGKIVDLAINVEEKVSNE